MLDVRAVPLAATRSLRQAVLRPHQTHEELAAHEPPGAFAAAAFANDELIAVGFIAPDGGPGAWRVRGMATAPEARGRGAGSRVLAALLAYAREHGATRVWCRARVRATTLYERAGFAVESDVFDVPQTGPHVVMGMLGDELARG